jgi:hypothetical protein
MERLHKNFRDFRSSHYFGMGKKGEDHLGQIWPSSVAVDDMCYLGKDWEPFCKIFWERRMDGGCYFSKVRGGFFKRPRNDRSGSSVRPIRRSRLARDVATLGSQLLVHESYIRDKYLFFLGQNQNRIEGPENGSVGPVKGAHPRIRIALMAQKMGV